MLIEQYPGTSSPCDHRDFYSRNYVEVATLLTLSQSSAAGGFELLTIGSASKRFATEVSRHLIFVNIVLVPQNGSAPVVAITKLGVDFIKVSVKVRKHSM